MTATQSEPQALKMRSAIDGENAWEYDWQEETKCTPIWSSAEVCINLPVAMGSVRCLLPLQAQRGRPGGYTNHLDKIFQGHEYMLSTIEEESSIAHRI